VSELEVSEGRGVQDWVPGFDRGRDKGSGKAVEHPVGRSGDSESPQGRGSACTGTEGSGDRPERVGAAGGAEGQSERTE
jgi:hypothetical protein